MSKTQIFQKANDPNENCSILTNTFLITEKHASLKKETVRGNYTPFITKGVRKAIDARSRLKNKFIENPSEINETY